MRTKKDNDTNKKVAPPDLSVETTKTQIVVQFCVADPHLKESAVEAEGQLRLVGVEVIHPHASYCFNIDWLFLRETISFSNSILYHNFSISTPLPNFVKSR